MRKMQPRWDAMRMRIALVLLLSVGLVACGGGATPQRAQPTSPGVPTVPKLAAATATRPPALTVAPTPTRTPLPPSPTPLPTPTASPTVTGSPPPTASHPTPTPAVTPVPTLPPVPWWRPPLKTTWQIQLNSGYIDTSYDVKMYIVDLFLTPAETIQTLRSDGREVMCYFSAGIYESWRDDAAQFPPEILGNPYLGLDIQRWVDIRALDTLAPILEARLDLAVSKGCSGVLPVGMDGYRHETGFPLTPADQLAFNEWLASKAHERELSIGLTEDDEQVADLVPTFDWGYTETCFANNTCDAWEPFLRRNLAVFDVEYDLTPDDFCPQANQMGISALIKDEGLGGWQFSCLTDYEP